MKAAFVTASLLALALLPAGAHPGHDYGVFWKSGLNVQRDARQPLPDDVWRFAFVSKFHW